jgi:hypothetical protein
MSKYRDRQEHSCNAMITIRCTKNEREQFNQIAKEKKKSLSKLIIEYLRNITK